MRYVFPVRLTLDGDQDFAASFVGEARVLLGELMHDLGETNQRIGQRQRVRKDVKIDVSYDGTLGAIRIQTATPGESSTTTFDLWVPQGILVEPANVAAPRGWGLPTTATDAAALDPGPLPDNWTAAGPQPQALLSRTIDAGYPKRTTTALPMYYDAPEKQGTFDLPQPTGDWAAYRASFADMGDDALAVLTAINDTRSPDKPLVPPYRGFSQLAAWYQRLTSKYGFVDADMPGGSNTFYKRVQKDGTALEVATASPIGSIGAVDTSGASNPSDVADALIAALPELSSDTSLPLGTTLALAGGGALTYLAAIDQNDQWVKCGNIDWKSIHGEIPRLSWFGSRGRSIPTQELGAGVAATTIYNGTPFPTESFYSYLLDESNTSFYDAPHFQFDKFIFARGRVLAQLPNSGYCLGAAVRKIVDPDPTVPVIYRLVAIAWHRADQKFHEAGEPAIDVSTPQAVCFDTTSDIRVWYADLPSRNGLVCAPDQIIDGIYDVDTNPAGWQAFSRHRITLADTDDSRVYWFGAPPEKLTDYATDHEYNAPKGYFQTWMFNGSGTEAVCIRSAARVDRPFGSLFGAGAFGPMQAIKCTVGDDSSIALIWHAPNGNVFDFGERWPIAWDYAGDAEVTAWFGSSDGSAAGTLRIEDTNGNALASWELLAQGWMALAFDARTNSVILASYTFGARPGFPSEIVTTNVDVLTFHDGALLDSHSFAIGLDAGTGSGYGGWGIITGYAYGPLWRDGYGHGDVLPALATFGDDVFTSCWFGASPGERSGDPPYDARADYAFIGAAVASSIADIGAMLGDDVAWSNFAGAV